MGLERVYEYARTCTDGPQDGARALMAWVLGAFGDKGARNLGIYNCRPIRGTNNTTSLHGEGRACDFGFPIGDPDGNVLAQLLVDYSDELDVQCVIYERRIWSAAYPDAGWRSYGGTNPHTDHIHCELNWSGARTLTPERIQQVLGGAVVVIPVDGGGAVLPPKGPRLLRKGDKGDDVMAVQQRLLALGYNLGQWGADGDFGDATEEAVIALQVNAGIDDDGIVGEDTRAALDRGVRAITRRIGYNFPLPADHWFGRPDKDSRNHSGFYWSGDRPHILAAMRGLRARGWSGAPLHDRYTPEVERAVRAYQDDDPTLTTDGLLGPKTWSRIDSSPVR